MRRLLACSIILAACHGKHPAHAFEGATYEMPDDALTSSSGNLLPGPGSDPTPVRLGITIYAPSPPVYSVEITKEPTRITFAGMKTTMAQLPDVSDVVGTTTATGWDASYHWKNPSGSTTTVHLHVASLPDADYQCQYDEAGSPDRAVADAICQSITAKP